MKKSMHPIATLVLRLARTAYTSRLVLAVWFFAISAFGAQQMSAAGLTYIVGTCKSGTQFSTIQSALDASPAPNKVQVCPGIYPEQITITNPVALEGISAEDWSEAQIVPPAGGLTENATLSSGDAAFAQVYVKNTSGKVDLTNLFVDGRDNNVSNNNLVIGVLYERSSGTINQVVTSSQTGANIIGYGIYLDGGSSNPSVTVENCSIHDFNQAGIWAMGSETAVDLTVTIKDNIVNASSPAYGIVVEFGTNPTVTSNVVSVGGFGIVAVAPEGSVTGNTVGGSDYGIAVFADGVSVKSNQIYDTSVGIYLNASGGLKVSEVQGNTITHGVGVNMGINLNCNSAGSPNRVHSNKLIDVLVGYGLAPAGFGGSNTYVSVEEDIDLQSCNSPLLKSSAAAHSLRSPYLSRGQ